MKKLRTKRVLGTLVALVTLTGGVGRAEALDPPNTPTQSAFGVLGNGAVSTIVPRGDVTYIGGNFDELAAITGAFARLSSATAKRIAPLAEVERGEVRASAADGHGGFYIGGTFTSIGGEPRQKIGHILADGSVDPKFNPGVPGQTSAVNALAVSVDRNTVYVGGGFDNIGGQSRNNLAAVEAATGNVTNFNPAGLGTDGQVFALEVSGKQVYVGGQFEKLGGQTRNGLAKVAGTTGGDLGWIPNPTFGGGGGLILALEAAGNYVYVGGVFTNIGGRARSHLAKLVARTGKAVAAFAPNPDDAVFSLVRSGRFLYAGGDFNTIGGQIRPAVARLVAANGNATAFNVDARMTDSVRALAVAGANLYVGGFFPDLGNPVVSSNNLVKVNANTGAGRQAFIAGIGDFDATVSVKTIAVQGARVYVGGDFSFVSRVTRHGIAALDFGRRPDRLRSGCRTRWPEYVQRRQRDRRQGQRHLPRRQFHVDVWPASKPDCQGLEGRHARPGFQPERHRRQHSRHRHHRGHECGCLRRRRLLHDRRPAAPRSREAQSEHGPGRRGTAILRPGSPQGREPEPGPSAPGFR